MFLKVPVIIIIRFGENNVLGTIYYINIIINFRGMQGGGHVSPDVVLFIDHKNGKITRA